jgi:hypothetical protein
MDVYHYKNFEMLDPDAGQLRGGHELVVEGDSISEVSAKPIKLAKASVVADLIEVATLGHERSKRHGCYCIRGRPGSAATSTDETCVAAEAPHAHSPFRNTGTRRPSACTPSMSI